MAVGKSTSNIYYGISNGRVVRQFDHPTPNSIERLNKNMRSVYEEFYDYVDGLLMDVFVRESEFGKYWMIVLQDTSSGASQVLQVPYSSGYAVSFLKTLPNVDIREPVTIIPNIRKEGEKTRSTLFIKQANTTLKWHYTKEHPNGLPSLRKTRVRGRDVWDDSQAMEFLEKMVKKDILPKLLKRSSKEILKSHPIDNSDGLPF